MQQIQTYILQSYNMILICFGTRPEFIKVKSLIDNIPNIKTCFTGQHSDLLKNVDADFVLEMDNTLSNNHLNNIMCNILKNTSIFENITQVIVQGDTTTATSIAISATNCGIAVTHLEAGLRSHNIHNPFPEEINRQLISRIANIHLCPTSNNKNNLMKEGVHGDIFVVGNTGLDNISKDGCEYGNKVLVTMHRNDNLDIMDKWFIAIEYIAISYPELEFICPLHPNPKIQQWKHLLQTVVTIDSLNHTDMIQYLKQCKFVISDSGGLQEECAFLNKKIIVCRKTTERPESIGIHSFMCESPTSLNNIVRNVNKNYAVNATCPYGDGHSWKRVRNIITSNDTIF
jgi:UDP-N-acetylglucosamine 2-epimerase (non-hydrolysing)